MREAKLNELKQEVEVMMQHHEREMDRKDAFIHMLDRDLDESAEQFLMAMRSHLQNVDKLIEIHTSSLAQLEFEFNMELATFKEEFSSERREIMKQHNREHNELMQIMNTMEQRFKDEEMAAFTMYNNLTEEIKSKKSEQNEMLRRQLMTQIQLLNNSFDQAHKHYLVTTEDPRETFKRMTADDMDYVKKIEENNKKILKLTEKVNHLKTKHSNNVKECVARNSSLQEEKDAIAKHFHELKGRMNKFRDAQSKRLKELTKNSNACMKELDKKVDKAEKILKLAEMNRKLETEREKVLPFYESTVEDYQEDEQEAEEVMNRVQSYQTSALTHEGKPVDEWHYLDSFYKRFNKVLLDKLALEREHGKLQQENEDLKTLLKQYLEGVSVTEGVMERPNPLLIVNRRTNAIIQPDSRVVDALANGEVPSVVFNVVEAQTMTSDRYG
eukprot:TRINITY_DN15109_c0_g2_i2.p1 TRINITY_DN15109_c0_g2~~TRINITY_DN15109_c0_g2_i2.p1  ORF type:complete len:442 (-),score=177.50 TRINITY_DN15109_c0_g2_i2:16-1341(-)